MLNVKEFLDELSLSEDDKSIFDAALAAYLINPLKSTYEYDDISRDYLGIMLPSKKRTAGQEEKYF